MVPLLPRCVCYIIQTCFVRIYIWSSWCRASSLKQHGEDSKEWVLSQTKPNHFCTFNSSLPPHIFHVNPFLNNPVHRISTVSRSIQAFSKPLFSNKNNHFGAVVHILPSEKPLVHSEAAWENNDPVKNVTEYTISKWRCTNVNDMDFLPTLKPNSTTRWSAPLKTA